jgi:hypothetical protein
LVFFVSGIVLKRPIERLAYRRDEAAAVLGVSLTKFEEWVARGLMPKPVKIDGCTLYDARQVDLAWQALRDGENISFDSRRVYNES